MHKKSQSLKTYALVFTVVVGSIFGTGQAAISAQDTAQPDVQSSVAVVQQDFGDLPLSFIPNAGQTDKTVHFQVNSLGGTLFFTPQEVVLSLPQRRDTNMAPVNRADVLIADTMQPPLTLKMQLIGANANTEIVGADLLPGIVNYFIGNDPSKWHTNIATYAGITYEGVYPGIDLHYDGHQGRLKGTYTVAAGVDPSLIRWRYEGNTALSIDEMTGDLLIDLSNGNVLREVAPTAWQEKLGQREAVDTRYALEDQAVRFAIDTYDAKLPLIIDPTFEYSTYLGGVSWDSGQGIAVDNDGSAYIAGFTMSTDFPTSDGAFQESFGDNTDAFVAKMTPAGNALSYSTFLGGSLGDIGNGIAVDSSGNAYILGDTYSTDFPLINPVQGSLNGARDLFVTKLTPTGNALSYSTFLGGSHADFSTGISVDKAHAAYVVGWTLSIDFPIANAFQDSLRGTQDAFVAKLTAAGSSLSYSTYLGGSGDEYGYGITVDSSGNAYVTGSTTSTNFPTGNAAQGAPGGSTDAFITKFMADGRDIRYSSYLGGSGTDIGYGVAVNSAGNLYIVGSTDSANFPTLHGFQSSLAGSSDAFVTTLIVDGTYVSSSTYLGGSGDDGGRSIAVDSAGFIYVTGATGSTNFPLYDALQTTHGGGQYDVFATKLTANNAGLIYSTFIGGSHTEIGYGIAVGSVGNAYITGFTISTNFPTVNPYRGTLSGPVEISDAFVTKLKDDSVTQPDTIGIFRPSDATFYLRYSNTTGYADSSLTFGAETNFPIVGDWNGDGIDTPGVYRRTTGEFLLTDSTTNPASVSYLLVLGIPNDQPIVGDWDGDGKDSVGVFRPSNGLIYLKNDLTTGFADFTMVLGIPGDVGIAGDWDDNGKDSPGVYRPSNQIFYLTNSTCNCAVFADAQLGLGIAGDTPFIGDWNGDGKSGVGVYRRSNGLTYIKNALTTGFADASFVFGSASDYPLAGYWVRMSSPSAVEAAPTFRP